MNVVSDMAGHGDPSITLTIYGHILQGMQDGAADAMDDALSKRHCTVMQRPVQSQAVSYLLSLGGLGSLP